MNRRIPNGSYGGVGGRELAAPSYPIFDQYIPTNINFDNTKYNWYLLLLLS